MYIIIKLEDEVFKPLYYNGELFEKYKISNYGTIISKRCPDGLKPFIDKDGYETVTLRRKDNSKKLCRVNRLVAYNFIEPIDDSSIIVNHLNNNRLDNYYLNLEWTSQKNNIRHAIEHGSFDPNNLKKYSVKTYDEEFIIKLCQHLEKYKKSKKVLDKLEVQDITQRRKITSLIFDLKHKKSWIEITKQYDI